MFRIRCGVQSVDVVLVSQSYLSLVDRMAPEVSIPDGVNAVFVLLHQWPKEVHDLCDLDAVARSCCSEKPHGVPTESGVVA